MIKRHAFLIFYLMAAFCLLVSENPPAYAVGGVIYSKAYVVCHGYNADGKIRVIDTGDNTVKDVIENGGMTYPTGIAVTPDGSGLYVLNGNEHSISFFDLNNGNQRRVIGPKSDPYINRSSLLSAIAITPDGKKAYVTEKWADRVHVLDTKTNTVIGKPIEVGSSPVGIAISPDGERAYVVNQGQGDNGSLTVINLKTGQPLKKTVHIGRAARGIALAPKMKKAYVTSDAFVIDDRQPGEVKMIDTDNLKVTRFLPVSYDGGDSLVGLSITPEETGLYVANQGKNQVFFFDFSNRNRVTSLYIDNPVGVAVTPDGQKAYVLTYDAIKVVNTESQMVEDSIDLQGGDQCFVAFSPLLPCGS